MKRILAVCSMAALGLSMISGCACTQGAGCEDLCNSTVGKCQGIETSCTAAAKAAEAAAQRAEAAARRAEAAADRAEASFKHRLKK